MAIPHGALCESQQIGKIDLFEISSQTLLSSSSDSSSSSGLDRIFTNMKTRNALTITLTPEIVQV